MQEAPESSMTKAAEGTFYLIIWIKHKPSCRSSLPAAVCSLFKMEHDCCYLLVSSFRMNRLELVRGYLRIYDWSNAASFGGRCCCCCLSLFEQSDEVFNCLIFGVTLATICFPLLDKVKNTENSNIKGDTWESDKKKTLTFSLQFLPDAAWMFFGLLCSQSSAILKTFKHKHKSLRMISPQTQHKESLTTSLLLHRGCGVHHLLPLKLLRASMKMSSQCGSATADLDSWKDHQGLSSMSWTSRGQKHCEWSITPSHLLSSQLPFVKMAVEGPVETGKETGKSFFSQTTEHKNSIWTVNITVTHCTYMYIYTHLHRLSLLLFNLLYIPTIVILTMTIKPTWL